MFDIDIIFFNFLKIKLFKDLEQTLLWNIKLYLK